MPTARYFLHEYFSSFNLTNKFESQKRINSIALLSDRLIENGEKIATEFMIDTCLEEAEFKCAAQSNRMTESGGYLSIL
jgi:hypothetical protein